MVAHHSHIAIKRAKCSVNFVESIANKLYRTSLSHALYRKREEEGWISFSFQIRCQTHTHTQRESDIVWCTYIEWWQNTLPNEKKEKKKRLKLSINCIADGKRRASVVNSKLLIRFIKHCLNCYAFCKSHIIFVHLWPQFIISLLRKKEHRSAQIYHKLKLRRIWELAETAAWKSSNFWRLTNCHSKCTKFW